jgi:hypothetical protein
LTAERLSTAFSDDRGREKELAKLIDQLFVISIRRDAELSGIPNGRRSGGVREALERPMKN